MMTEGDALLAETTEADQDPTTEIPVAAPAPSEQVAVGSEGPERPSLQELIRPALCAALAVAGAGFVAGGIFGSWFARGLGITAAFFGAGAVVVALRSRQTNTVVMLFPIATAIVSVASLAGSAGGPANVGGAVRAAINAGRLLRPPVPFDPGWRPVMIFVLALLGFAAGWMSTALQKPNLAIGISLPVIALTAITQPHAGQFIAGVGALLFILASLAALFGGDLSRAKELGSQFELRRALKAGAVAVPLIALLVVFNSAGFLFPKPVYNPTSSPQRPRVLSNPPDVVLFQVLRTGGFTGPWRTGALDVYDGTAWELPPYDTSRLQSVKSGAPLPTPRPPGVTHAVIIVTRNLGNTAILPDLGGTASITMASTSGLAYDPRSDVFRETGGRIPSGLQYTLQVPRYATVAELRSAQAASGAPLAQQLAVPPPPPYVGQLLARAPAGAWARLDFVLNQLIQNVTASGPGTPTAVTPARVDDLLDGSKTGSPYEIVAAEALLARWAGFPSRIGFGFDGLNKEITGAITVRPRNAAQWLEVDFQGYGWIPLIITPRHAQVPLNNNHNVRPNTHILPSNNAVAELYIPYRINGVVQLYQRIQNLVLSWLPLAAALVLAYMLSPAMAKIARRSKRRRWAAAIGPAAQVAVEYSEFRDLATDLNVADIYTTPLEYLFHVQRDEEHLEFAWLTARVLYGDLGQTARPADVLAAHELGLAMRRRLRRGQPIHSQILAYLSRASLQFPYSPELPNVGLWKLPSLSGLLRAAGRTTGRWVISLTRAGARPGMSVLGAGSSGMSSVIQIFRRSEK